MPRMPVLLGALLVITLAGCAAAPGASSPAGTTGAPATAATAAPSIPPIQPTIALGSPTVGPNGLAIDPRLLLILPAALGDLPVAESADLEASVLQDPELPKHADSYAGAVVGDLGGSDWATAAVVKLRPESSNETYYAAWRSDYDTAACDQAGGVASSETLAAAGRSIDHVTCQGGVDLYHAWLPDQGEIVSVTSLGPLDLGRQLIEALRL